MKILLATDGSVHSKIVLEKVAARLFPPNTELLIVSAFENSLLIMSSPAPMGGLGGYYEEADAIARQLAEDAVKNAAKFLEEKTISLKITTAVIEGSAKSIILKEAETFGADLIIVGSHGAGATERFLLGSVSQAVALHAKCSVEIVRK